jgi:ATP-dependent Lhr-like helicase
MSAPMALTSFHPTVARWFRERFGEPTRPQREGWPAIRAGGACLIAAPTGSGKTFAAFLHALDDLVRRPRTDAKDGTRVLYVSPLKALSNDVRNNLTGPLAELRALDDTLPEIRVEVRTGDTPQNERARMTRTPPDVLVTTPESLYVLLTSAGGRGILRGVETVIVDEIHALAPDKRGAHLALTLERLDHWLGRCGRGPAQRIGLSATQRPLSRIAEFLVGDLDTRPCAIVDAGGHRRELDLALEIPDSPLETVCADETWQEAYRRLVELIEAHRTTLVFTNTRKLAERTARRLTETLGPKVVTSHHGSLSRARRLDAEQRLKAGELKALCATASLELGIDIGDVDLVVQLGVPSSIATFLQRVGRAGHGPGRVPKGRLFAMTRDEAVAAAALLRAVHEGELDETIVPPGPLDILGQQIVATCVQTSAKDATGASQPQARGGRGAGRSEPTANEPRDRASAGGEAERRRGRSDDEPSAEPSRVRGAAGSGTRPASDDSDGAVHEPGAFGDAEGESRSPATGIDEDELFALCRRALPYRDLDRAAFDATIHLHAEGRLALLHRDSVGRRLRATKRARLPALTSGGAIPDTAEVELREDGDGQLLGTVSEDFAVESSIGDVFLFGNTSWQITGFDKGRLRVKNAGDRPSTLPFWFGEAPGRSRELAAAVARLREDALDAASVESLCRVPRAAASQIAAHVRTAREELGVVPSQHDLVLERFFDDTGGMQLVLHSPFGSRINRALGLALRKRFCRGFGFELQAAADEDAIVLSLGPMHSFPLAEVFDYLHPETARDVLVQALLPTPMFKTRWRWNVGRALVVPRFGAGKRVPPPILRARADDSLAAAFPEIMACGETLPPGDFPVPDHPLVRQTIEDCLHEAMDVEGMLAVLRGLRDGSIRRHAVDRAAPSLWARTILAARPYAFLDDAPLEERRTAAVGSGRARAFAEDQVPGDLDPEVVHRVREEAWPAPQDVEECHEALTWMGFVTLQEAPEWRAWLDELVAAGRVVAESRADRTVRYFAVEAPRELLPALRGRLEALGPIRAADGEEEAVLRQLEARGEVFQVRLLGDVCWCNRRLLARIHAGMREARRPRFEPLQPTELLAFLEDWQAISEGRRVEATPALVRSVLERLSGVTATANEWEWSILHHRVLGGRAAVRPVVDELCLRGEIVWARLWGRGNQAPRAVRIGLVPRRDLAIWRGLGGSHDGAAGGDAETPGAGSAAPDRLGTGGSPSADRASNGSSPGGRTVNSDAYDLGASAHAVFEVLRTHGASFFDDLHDHARLLPSQLEEGLAELVGRGLATCDSFAALRALLVPASKRRAHTPALASGRWSLLPLPSAPAPTEDDPLAAERVDEFVFDRLLQRYGVLTRRLLLDAAPPGTLPRWRNLVRVGRRRELEGTVLGGRFVAGHSGEQFALPSALDLLRKARGRRPEAVLPASDPARPSMGSDEAEVLPPSPEAAVAT